MELIPASELQEITKRAAVRKSLNELLKLAANKGDSQIIISAQSILYEWLNNDRDIISDLKSAGYSVSCPTEGLKISWEEEYSADEINKVPSEIKKILGL